MAGFLFGFDTVVISGADQPIQALWGTEGFTHTFFIMSMALWGTVIGAIFGGIPCDIIGRKRTLFWIGVLYFVSALGSALAWDPVSFSFFRFIGGLGVGASSVAAPVYISEISSANNRGRLVALYQFNIVFGIFIAFFSNYFLGAYIEENAWRYMLGIEALPAIIYVLMVLNVPNSPRWLAVKKRDEAGARAVLAKMYTADEVESQLQAIKDAEVNATRKPQQSLFSSKYSFPLMLAFLLAFFNQASGINFVLYFAPRLLEAAGIGQEEVLLQSTSIGAVNLVFTLLGMYLIDRMGRRSLMYIGSFGYIMSLSIIAWGYATGQPAMLILTSILLFIASHAVGQGAVIW
ncbi:MAG: sugar porter family MFS transporter, partial [Bacteroidota bacterium]